MRKSKLKQYIILESNNKKYLYGRIYDDKRFPNGHLVLTSKLEKLEKDNNIATTINGTEYLLENELTKEEFASMIKNNYVDEDYINFLLSPLN